MSPVGRDDLGFKIKTISKLLTQNMNNSIMSLDLTSSQALVLGYLCYRTRRQETVYPRDIERHFHFTHPTVSGLLQRLEMKGYLSSEPSPEDRRCKQILVTNRALEANQQVLDHLAASEQQLVSDMSRVEITQLHSFLDRMIQNLSASNGAPQAADQFPRPADETEREPEDRSWRSADFR
ncbi:MAG TPA: MarR family transcriptional regulator [Candidatus Fournierella excrementigallinarum]|nr:MarR family transcriptional regulator [Candidatus Fournierella excrementigallinarum]